MKCFTCGNDKYFVKLKPEFCSTDNYLCMTCGLVFIPHEHSSMKDYYKNDGYYVKSPNLSVRKIFVNKRILLKLAEERAQEMVRFFKIDFSSKRVLSIGCGYGEDLYFLKKKFNCFVEGIEPSKIASGYGENVFDIKINNILLEEYFPKNKFDVIICSHVLEHVDDPIIFLKKIKKLLFPTGLFYVETPNILEPTGKFSLNKFLYSEHLQNFSIYNLNLLLNKLGLFVEAYSDIDFLRFWCALDHSKQLPIASVSPTDVLESLKKYKMNYHLFNYLEVYFNKFKYLIKLLFVN
jgi:SAM-dependent methyltransferase